MISRLRSAVWSTPVAIALLTVATWGFPLSAQASGQCGAARDLMVQALERVGPGSAPDEIRDANELLKRSTRLCAELGDAWYYRSVFETHLNNPRGAQVALSEASMLGADAMRDKLDPFHLAAPLDAPPSTATSPPTRWALVVGIGAFTDRNIPALAHTVDDAKLFAATLTDPGVGGFAPDHVRTLIDDTATTEYIRASLNWLARSAQPQDLVVIYVATHGSSRENDPIAGASYLLTHDTRIGANTDQDMLFGSALAMNDLVATVANRISARRTAIFIDTCYSGNTGASGHGESVSERDLGRFHQGAGRIVITAAQADQESRESSTLGHGYFTWFLVQALRAPTAPHQLSAIFDRLAIDVPARVAADAKPIHVEQNPVLSRSTPETDFTLTIH